LDFYKSITVIVFIWKKKRRKSKKNFSAFLTAVFWKIDPISESIKINHFAFAISVPPHGKAGIAFRTAYGFSVSKMIPIRINYRLVFDHDHVKNKCIIHTKK